MHDTGTARRLDATELALQQLQRAGYTAKPSVLCDPGWIDIQDPVMVSNGGNTQRTEFKRATVHHTGVHKFISDRS
ncbi:MAG: hypothetical protein Q7U48_13755 [Hydrogenophaga sp.]|nr:hypothetical protein [Hydrogenophaga sp.]